MQTTSRRQEEKRQAEKRWAPRVEVKLIADLRTKYIFTTAVVINVSPTGMCIKNQNHLPEGSEIEILIHTGAKRKPRPLKGVVQWERKSTTGSVPSGMGIKLDDDGDNLSRRMANIINNTPKNV